MLYLRLAGQFWVCLLTFFFTERFWAHKNTSQAKTNQQNKNKRTLNNNGNNFSRARKLIWGTNVFVLLVKQTQICSDNLKHNTTEEFPPPPPPPPHTHPQPTYLLSHVCICMNARTLQVLVFLLEILWDELFLTESWILIFINITKLWLLSLLWQYFR